jgi:hypothetical protein
VARKGTAKVVGVAEVARVVSAAAELLSAAQALALVVPRLAAAGWVAAIEESAADLAVVAEGLRALALDEAQSARRGGA